MSNVEALKCSQFRKRH